MLTDAAADGPDELLAKLLAEAVGQGAAGVPALYRYAAEKMRSKLGGLDVFERAFGNELYSPLLTHDRAVAGEPQVIDGSARVALEVELAGERIVYLLGMVRLGHGPRAGRWALSGVVREGVDL